MENLDNEKQVQLHLIKLKKDEISEKKKNIKKTKQNEVSEIIDKENKLQKINSITQKMM